MTQHTSLNKSHIEKDIISLLEDHKAKDIVVLNVSHITDITNSMVICTANSSRHSKALADYIVATAKKKGVEVLGVEGDQEGEWILIDLIDIIIHIMLPNVRELYNLERLWGTPT